MRVVVSDAALRVLSSGELEMAVRHERAHAESRDNLKRLLILLAPGLGLGELERSWKRFAEWAADDRATAGDEQRAVVLADALVRIAKLGCCEPAPLITAFLARSKDLEERVERLLKPRGSETGWGWWLGVAGSLGMVAACAGMANLERVHDLLEQLVH
jgi:hypothetical protein